MVADEELQNPSEVLLRLVAPEIGRWTGEGGALDLWLGLMAGTTVTIVERIAQAA